MTWNSTSSSNSAVQMHAQRPADQNFGAYAHREFTYQIPRGAIRLSNNRG